MKEHVIAGILLLVLIALVAGVILALGVEIVDQIKRG